MDSTIKSQWVAALRSGDYKQGRQVLKQGDTYCCLGVLCDLHSKAHPDNLHSWRRMRDQDGWYENCYRYDGMTIQLPHKVQNWAGLHSDDPYIDIVYSKFQHATKSLSQLHATKSLSQLNDQGYTFAEIAQLIEEQL